MSSAQTNLMTTYASLPIALERGEGVWLWDTDGKQYLDAMTGIAVCGLGHCHPAVTDAIVSQAQKLLHTSNVYQIPAQQVLSQELARLAGMEKIFFCNSGAEANEAALKLARLWGHKKNIDEPEVIVMENAFHGRTLATLSASGSHKVHAGFEPLVPGFVRAPYNQLEAIEKIAQQRVQSISAILVEPVQGEGGIIPAAPGYLEGLRKICDQHQWLLMLDEVQTGIGRTGKFYAYQHTSILPDVVASAKGLGNGVPIGACLARGEAAHLFQPGNHGSTFGGNPLSMRAAYAVIKTIDEQQIAANAAARGEQLLAGLRQALSTMLEIKAIRGKGLMLGIELDRPCRDALTYGIEHGILFNVTAEKVIRLLPPLIITSEQIDELIKRLKQSLHAYFKKAKN